MEIKKQHNSPKFIAVSGGVGGAKLALGLEKIVQSQDLMVIGNVGDDFRHFGLHISPKVIFSHFISTSPLAHLILLKYLIRVFLIQQEFLMDGDDLLPHI